jgi:hypothetical protein
MRWSSPASFIQSVFVREIAAAEPSQACSPGEDEVNQRLIAYMDHMDELNGVVLAAVAAIEQGSRDMYPLTNAIDDYQSQWTQFQYYLCSPSGFELRNKIYASQSAVGAGANRAITAVNSLMTSFHSDVQALSPPISDLEKLRVRFENEVNLPTDLPDQFQAADQRFGAAKARCDQYRLKPYTIKGTHWDPSQDQRTVTTLAQYEAKLAAFVELDQLRLEYVSLSIPCPPPYEFSQGKSCGYAGSAELYQDSAYSWGILPDELLAKIDLIGGAFATKGWVTAGGRRITSAYRSPMRNAAVGGARYSRHMYGRAADFHVFDLNGDGGITKAQDWQPMMNEAQSVGGTDGYVEDFIPDRPHVHTQFTGWGTPTPAARLQEEADT